MDGPTPSKQAKTTDATGEQQETHDEPIKPHPSSSKKDFVERESTLEILEQIDICQGELENLNEAASEEIISIEEKFNKLRQPHIDKRNEFIQKIPNFWICTFVNHPQIAPRLSEVDEECLHYLRQLNIHNYDDLKAGYSITFHFADNPFFENQTICKEFSLTEDGEPLSKSSKIQWRPGMDITKKQSKDKGKVDVPCSSFFGWFSDHLDAGNDEIADVLRDDLWSNPLQYYLIPDVDDSFDRSLLMDSIYSDDNDDVEMKRDEVASRPSATKKDCVDDVQRMIEEKNSSTKEDNKKVLEDKTVENSCTKESEKTTNDEDVS